MDQWGASLESKWPAGNFSGLASNEYFAIGGDIRGIDQDLDARFTLRSAPAYLVTYSEELDTRYYGAYLAWGGTYQPFLFGSLWKSWGLQSSFRLHGGIYYADTDYSGRIDQRGTTAAFDPTSALSLSRGDVAFIGGLTTETRMPISARASLSLKSVYEYYSWVPSMTYNTSDGPEFNAPDRQAGTRIGSDDAFSMRTSLRLTIGLGPDELYAK